jgi:hypothetical protein
MGYRPLSSPLPPQYPEDPISVADESTFDAWMRLDPLDSRTIEEFAANPIHHYRGAELPSAHGLGGTGEIRIDTGFMRSSFMPLPPGNRFIKY